ncbi:hypothetical protein D3C71_2064700 [compost metagenome]
MRAGSERCLGVGPVIAPHPRLPAGRAQILPHDFQTDLVGLLLIASVVILVRCIPDVAWVVGAQHVDLLSWPRIDGGQAKHF